MENETVLRFVVERDKERNPLNMVPVKMRDENMGAHGAAVELLTQLLAQRAKSGTAIENK